jgi:hypothetical protein
MNIGSKQLTPTNNCVATMTITPENKCPSIANITPVMPKEIILKANIHPAIDASPVNSHDKTEKAIISNQRAVLVKKPIVQ